MKNTGKKVNNDIAFFKFIYSWFIVFYHFGPTHSRFEAGYFGVEFYLLVAGVFFFQSYEKQRESGALMSPGDYFKKRFGRLFPWAFTAFLYSVAVLRRSFFLEDFSLSGLLDYMTDDIWDVLLIKWNGMNINNGMPLNVPSWTMSSLMIVGFLLWAVLYHYDKKFLDFFMPLTLIMGYGFWRHIPEANTGVWLGFTTVGTMRAYLAMCLGYYSLQLSKKLSSVTFNRWGECLLGLCELGCHAFAFGSMLFFPTRNFQWMTTLMILLAVAIAMSGKSMLYKLLQRCRFISWLQDISMSVYLVHFATLSIFLHFFGETLSAGRILILIVLIMVCSVCHYYITKYLIKASKALWRGLRRRLEA